MKRRVIEELRPTLLDNMGLLAALRWQAEQTCQAANIDLRITLPDDEPALNNDVSIAVFRVVQETLINMVKHAHATTVKVVAQVAWGELTITIEDNGVGMPLSGDTQSGSHGLLSMRHRIQAIGGGFSLGAAKPQGLKTVIRVPFERANVMANAG